MTRKGRRRERLYRTNNGKKTQKRESIFSVCVCVGFVFLVCVLCFVSSSLCLVLLPPKPQLSFPLFLLSLSLYYLSLFLFLLLHLCLLLTHPCTCITVHPTHPSSICLSFLSLTSSSPGSAATPPNSVYVYMYVYRCVVCVCVFMDSYVCMCVCGCMYLSNRRIQPR